MEVGSNGAVGEISNDISQKKRTSSYKDNRLLVTSRIWLKVSDLRWVAGTVESVDEKNLTIRTEDGMLVSVPRGSNRISQRTPPGMVAIDDLTALPDLDEPNMLDSLCQRYLQHKIYTRTGPILVGMNPWQDLRLYAPEVLHSYRKQQMNSMPPHVFAVSETAFANLQAERKDQTILVSGDSGSGKTESTKFMMQYLAAVANHTQKTANIEQRVLQCNPVLEAFGNAKTLRNDNSSRFGKYIDINFDSSFAISGAKIDTYLLEKSRVVSQQPGERNFHIFYQLCSQVGKDAYFSNILALRPAEDFNYLYQGAHVTVSYKAANSFENTVEAFMAIGIPQNEQEEIFKVIGAVMHMGNIKISSDKDGNSVIDPNSTDAINCTRLLGCSHHDLINALMQRQIQAGILGSGDNYLVAQTCQQAMDARDALARALYEHMFSALVQRINVSFGMVNNELNGTSQKNHKIISILDIFGFEHFKTNYFEQMCINYANEKLQGHFNEYNFSLEVIEYQREQIDWSYSDFKFETNTKCIELIEGKRNGLFALLDEQCIMPNGSDSTFCTKIQQEFASHPHFSVVKMSSSQFQIKHYAADVIYDANGFCFKNKDPVQPALVSLMCNQTSPFVKELFKRFVHNDLSSIAGSPTRGRSTIIFESVTMQFKRQLGDLMARINAAQPHFVRCINPNSQKMPKLIEPEMILDQLRCSGLMEAVRVSRAGFPVRILHEDFIYRYSILVQPINISEDRLNVIEMIRQMKISIENFRVGLTKVFLRRAVHERMEEDRSRLLVREASTIQRVCRGHMARKLFRKIKKMRNDAARALQGQSRMAINRIKYAMLLKKRYEALRIAAENAKLAESQEKEREKERELVKEQERKEVRAPPPPAPVVPVKEVARPANDVIVAPREIPFQQTPEATYISDLLWSIRTSANSFDIDTKKKEIEAKMAKNSGWYQDVLKACESLLQEKQDFLTEIKNLHATVDHNAKNKVDVLTKEIVGKNSEIHQLTQWLVEARAHAKDPIYVRRQLEEQFQMKISSQNRVIEEVVRQLELTKAELRWKEAENADLVNRVSRQMASSSGPRIDPHDGRLYSSAQQYSSSRNSFDGEFSPFRSTSGISQEHLKAAMPSDPLMRSKDERIRELSRQLEEQQRRYVTMEQQLSSELQQRNAMMHEVIREKDMKLEEMGIRLYMLTEAAMRQKDRQLNGW
ncbi:myosin [Guillardia theta CCMP2712]|uniref:Myosin n=1 Tax=Guillardia theta (strain CCMP2712) TaxID=905079 RepID=L1ITH2_GUITC|nr:myosin [Guillardia theta CCMP2712]EKX39533.1 myosin [Guillardia theta CCMP2712]|eukprot:XP_005826513.1 myosin [Guillardia theta CCMP2712]